jgi:spore germination protein GerM
MNRWVFPGALAFGLLGAVLWFVLTYEPRETVVGDLDLEIAEELGTRSVTLFFSRDDAQGFVGETRSIPTGSRRDEEVETVIAELLEGPQAKTAVSAFPRGTQLRRAYYDDRERVLYLDFNSAMVSELNAGSAAELALLGSLLRTVAIGFPEVASVQILIDGLEVETLGGHVDLTRPLRTGDWL